MAKPSAIRLAKPKMITTLLDNPAPAAPATTANVVTLPSMPPYTNSPKYSCAEVSQPALPKWCSWCGCCCMPHKGNGYNSNANPISVSALLFYIALDVLNDFSCNVNPCCFFYALQARAGVYLYNQWPSAGEQHVHTCNAKTQ